MVNNYLIDDTGFKTSMKHIYPGNFLIQIDYGLNRMEQYRSSTSFRKFIGEFNDAERIINHICHNRPTFFSPSEDYTGPLLNYLIDDFRLL